MEAAKDPPNSLSSTPLQKLLPMFMQDRVPSWRDIRPRLISASGAMRSKAFADASTKSTSPLRLAVSVVKPLFFLVADLKDPSSDALALSIPGLDVYMDMAASGDFGIVADVSKLKALRVGREQFRSVFSAQQEAYSGICRLLAQRQRRQSVRRDLGLVASSSEP